MHYIAAAFVLLTYPGLVYLLRSNPQHRHWAYFFLGMLPFTVHIWNLDSAIINWAAWPGYAKGVVLTVVDTLALAIIATMRQPRGAPPLIGWLALYMGAVAFSITQAAIPMAAFFYLFQLLRFGMVMWAVAKIVSEPRALQWLGMGLASGMIYEAFVTSQQKIAGAFQAAGTMAHQNQLGMMANFVLLILLGMLLAGYRSRVLMLGVASSLIVVVLGASKATIGFGGLGVALVLILSMFRRVTPQKKKMVGLAAAAMVVATPFLANALSMRIAQQVEHDSGYDERAAFERAAESMWHDHPLGVGANSYVNVANTDGYSVRAGVALIGSSLRTNVHNTYLLIGSETGWAGLVTFIGLIVATFFAGWRFAFGNRNDPRGDIALGSTIALAVMLFHAKYEWITMTYHVQYIIAMSVGIVSGLVRMRALERKQLRRDKAAARAAMEPSTEQAIA